MLYHCSDNFLSQRVHRTNNAVMNNNVVKLIQIQLQIVPSNQLVEPKAQKFVHVTHVSFTNCSQGLPRKVPHNVVLVQLVA